MTNDGIQGNEGLMTPEELQEFREQMATKKLERQRTSLLKEMLEKDEQKDVYSELYKSGGLKDMVDKDPSLLDNRTLFIRAAGLCKKDYQRRLEDEDRAKKEAEVKAQAAAVPADPKGNNQPDNNSGKKDFDKASMDVFSKEHLESLPLKSSQRAFFEAMKPKNTEKWRNK